MTDHGYFNPPVLPDPALKDYTIKDYHRSLQVDDPHPVESQDRPVKLTLYTKADADEFVRLCDLTGVTPVCTVLQADPVGRPDAYLWHFEIEEI